MYHVSDVYCNVLLRFDLMHITHTYSLKKGKICYWVLEDANNCALCS